MPKYTGSRVGSDNVERSGDHLTIVTAAPMDGWEVRKYRAPVIRYSRRTWRITARTTEPDTRTRYELEAWVPVAGDVTGPEIEYTEDYVALRDQAVAIGRRRSRGTMWLNYVSPLTGFLPARIKNRLEVQYGIDPVTSTKCSIFIEALITLAGFVLGSIGTMVIAFGYPSPIIPALVVGIGTVCGIDAGVRLGRVLSEERPPPGFYEWLFKRRR